MERIFGLPAHPLIVHFPVVAIPLLALLIFGLVSRPSWLDTIGIGVGVFAVVTAVATLLATRSGNAFAELLNAEDNIDVHRTLGEQLRIIVIVQATAVVLMVISNITRFFEQDHLIYRALSGLAVLSSVVAVVWAIRTGHSGAEQSWGFLS